MSFTLGLILGLLGAMPAQAAVFANLANTGICVAKSGSAVVGWYCSSKFSQLNLAANKLKFVDPNSRTEFCVHANTATTLMAAPCADTPRQRFYHHFWNGPIFSGQYGGAYKLYWTGSLGGTIGMTKTYPTHPTRNWSKR